jgi:hypothetical protein
MARAALAEATVGPLILESDDCTIVIPIAARAEPDATGNLLVTLA